MKNNFKNALRTIEEKKSLRVASHGKINSIGYSTRQQMIQLLNKQKNGEEFNVQIFLDNNLMQQQREIADIAMSLLPINEFKTSIILPEEYDHMIDGSERSEPNHIDFEYLFEKFGQESFINYQNIIYEIGSEEAYKFIEMYLARKQFINQDESTDIVINPSYVNGLSGILTNGEVNKRVNRTKLFAKVEYNQ